MRIVFVLFVYLIAAVGRFDAIISKDPKIQSDRGAKSRKPDIHGPWIVHLKRGETHESFEESLNILRSKESPPISITNRFYHVLHAVVVSGVTKETLSQMPGVKRAVPVTKKRILLDLPTRAASAPMMISPSASVASWGLDRLDQSSLPLDGSYTPFYTGRGVDVYVVDTGIDTLHREFASDNGVSERTVENVFDAFDEADKRSPGRNTDGQGHGTHVAGTIGGRTVGVSPGANIYGLKVLSDEGEGDSDTILEALEYVITLYRGRSPRRPAVVSMSLGGPCETESSCGEDSLVLAVEALSSAGIAVSVASGNEGCNACEGSPNGAPSAINVGAIDESDGVTYFSNFGQCIDVFAPGLEILSACAPAMCGEGVHDAYVSLSGTSMACPHVSGVVAQLLQKEPGATPAEVLRALSCDAAREKASLDPKDSISRNLILQVPRSDTPFAACDLGAGCPSDCSGNGVCMPSHLGSVVTASNGIMMKGRRHLNSPRAKKNGSVRPSPTSPMVSLIRPGYSTENTCHCEAGTYGSDCSAASDPMCETPNTANVDVFMTDSYGDGWTFTNYAITDRNTGNIVDGAYDSLCYEAEGVHSYCLEKGSCYNFEVSYGYHPEEVGWQLCDSNGGAPYSGAFCIDSQGECSFVCDTGAFVDLTLSDSYGDGWNGAYYSIFSATGKVLFGGTLSDGEEESDRLCLPKGCSYLLMAQPGESPSEASYSVCGAVGGAKDTLQICIDDKGGCEATVLSKVPNPTCSLNNVNLLMFDLEGSGWGDVTYKVSPLNSSSSFAIPLEGGLASGFYAMEQLCLPDGCYRFDVSSAAASTLPIGSQHDVFWSACGRRGFSPWHSKLCLEKAYGLCYGLSGCPYLKSYLHSSDLQMVFISHVDEDYGIEVIDSLESIHGVNELCGMSDICYSVYAGSGRRISTEEGKTFELCGVSELTLPLSASLCFSGNGTTCTVSDIIQSSCSDKIGSISQQLVKIDAYGDGWDGVKYYIRKDSASSSSKPLYSGTVEIGQIDADELCLEIGSCYTFSIPDSEYADEMLWNLCGYLGSAPTNKKRFCVTETGCYFPDLTDDAFNRETDDDFPALPVPHPTARPSTEDDYFPISLPTSEPEYSSRSPSHRPTSRPSKKSEAPVKDDRLWTDVLVVNINISLHTVPLNSLNSGEDDQSSSVTARAEDVAFVGYAVKHLLETEGKIEVWDVETAVFPSGEGVPLSSSSSTASAAGTVRERPSLYPFIGMTEMSGKDQREPLAQNLRALLSVYLAKEGEADERVIDLLRSGVLAAASARMHSPYDHLNILHRNDRQLQEDLEVSRLLCQVTLSAPIDQGSTSPSPSSAVLRARIEAFLEGSLSSGSLQREIDAALKGINSLDQRDSSSAKVFAKAAADSVIVCPTVRVVPVPESDKSSDDVYDRIFPGDEGKESDDRGGGGSLDESETIVVALTSSLATMVLIFAGYVVYSHFCSPQNRGVLVDGDGVELAAASGGRRRVMVKGGVEYGNVMDASGHSPIHLDSIHHHRLPEEDSQHDLDSAENGDSEIDFSNVYGGTEDIPQESNVYDNPTLRPQRSKGIQHKFMQRVSSILERRESSGSSNSKYSSPTSSTSVVGDDVVVTVSNINSSFSGAVGEKGFDGINTARQGDSYEDVSL